MKSSTSAERAGEGGYTGAVPRPHHIPAIPHVPSSILQCRGRGRALSQAVSLCAERGLCPLGVSCYQGINHKPSLAHCTGQIPALHPRALSRHIRCCHKQGTHSLCPGSPPSSTTSHCEPVKITLVMRGEALPHLTSPQTP